MAETQSRTERTVRIMYMPYSYGLYNTDDPIHDNAYDEFIDLRIEREKHAADDAAVL